MSNATQSISIVWSLMLLFKVTVAVVDHVVLFSVCVCVFRGCLSWPISFSVCFNCTGRMHVQINVNQVSTFYF